MKFIGAGMGFLLCLCASGELQNVEVGSQLRVQRSPDGTATYRIDPRQAVMEQTTRSKASLGEYRIEARFYQVLAPVEETGVMQTIAGKEGWLQTVHQRFDDVALTMEGEMLTWNGGEEPHNRRIIGISAPTVITGTGKAALISIGTSEPVQYMVRNDGQFALRSYTPGAGNDPIGVTLSVTPRTTAGDAIMLDLDLSFRYLWVKDRQKVDGVNLDVGEPILGRVVSEESLRTRLGDWLCYQTSVEPEGMVLLFVRASRADAALPSGGQSERQDAAAEKEVGTGKEPAAAPGGLKDVQIGGSTRIRTEYRSGGPAKGAAVNSRTRIGVKLGGAGGGE